MPRLAQQTRSKTTESTLLSAAERMVEQMPFERLSVSAIAREAGVSVGAFYGRFESKEELLMVLHQRYEDHRNKFFVSHFEQSDWRDADLEARVLGVVTAIVSLMSERRGLLRSFLLHYWSHPDEMIGKTASDLDRAYKMARNLMLACDDEIAADDPKRACDLVMAIVAGACRDVIVMKPTHAPGAVNAHEKDLVAALASAAIGILCNPVKDKSR